MVFFFGLVWCGLNGYGYVSRVRSFVRSGNLRMDGYCSIFRDFGKEWMDGWMDMVEVFRIFG